jgi:hypothetical protein
MSPNPICVDHHADLPADHSSGYDADLSHDPVVHKVRSDILRDIFPRYL